MIGDSKAKKIVVGGRTVTDRTPAKKLNPYVAAQLKATLLRPDVSVELRRDPGSDSYYVKDGNGHVLFYYVNGWDYGQYTLYLGGKVVAEMEWYENDNHTNKDQQAIFDLANAIAEKRMSSENLKAAEKNLTEEEIEALKILNIAGKKQK